MTLTQKNALKEIIKNMRDRLEIDDFIGEWGRNITNKQLKILQKMLDAEE